MAHIDVINFGGETVGSLELADEIFAPEQINEALLWEAVKHYRAAMRQGTAATKNKKLVSGSGKKLWKQKGTGRARVGSVRSPIWRHGGTVHGLRLPPQEAARCSALRAGLQARRWQADRSRKPGTGGRQDQGLSCGARQARCQADHSAGRGRPGARALATARCAQPPPRGVDADQGSPSLRPAAL
jgi:hypothetical protein